MFLALKLKCPSESRWKGWLSPLIFEEQDNYFFAKVDAMSSYPNLHDFFPQVPAALLLFRFLNLGLANCNYSSKGSRGSHTLPPPSYPYRSYRHFSVSNLTANSHQFL
ncbi:unnamed protein product [Prunus armeniaca]